MVEPEGTESVDSFKYGYMYEAGYESFLTNIGIGATVVASGLALFAGVRHIFNKLKERKLKKQAALNQKNIDEATIHINSEADLEIFFKKEKNVIQKLNNTYQYKEKDFPTTAFISYMGNSPLRFKFKTRDTIDDVKNANGLFYHKIEWLDVDIQPYVIGCLENIVTDIKLDRNGKFILIFENKANKKIIAVSEDEDYYNKYGQFGKIIDNIFTYIRDSSNNQDGTRNLELAREGSYIFTTDLLIDLLEEIYNIIESATEYYLREMGYGNIGVLNETNIINVLGTVFDGILLFPIKYTNAQATPNLV